ncbi:hypothetical protein DFH06DRAFT_1230660 [Mycena polygramma]|nr:hypothetical protein DFH06DRAFT_1230660 [Mycena polygramma]
MLLLQIRGWRYTGGEHRRVAVSAKAASHFILPVAPITSLSTCATFQGQWRADGRSSRQEVCNRVCARHSRVCRPSCAVPPSKPVLTMGELVGLSADVCRLPARTMRPYFLLAGRRGIWTGAAARTDPTISGLGRPTALSSTISPKFLRLPASYIYHLIPSYECCTVCSRHTYHRVYPLDLVYMRHTLSHPPCFLLCVRFHYIMSIS